MLLAAMLAMVLAAAVPAMAQSLSQEDNGNVANVACVQTAVQNQGEVNQVAVSQYGDATNINVQLIAQECNIAVAQVNTIINGDDNGDKNYYDKDYDKKYYKDYDKKYYDKDYDKKYYDKYDKAPHYQYKYDD